MVDKYGVKIVEGSILVTKENTGPVPGRIWLGIAVADPHDGALWFQSSNLLVKLHASQGDDWQVVLPPRGCDLTYRYINPAEAMKARQADG